MAELPQVSATDPARFDKDMKAAMTEIAKRVGRQAPIVGDRLLLRRRHDLAPARRPRRSACQRRRRSTDRSRRAATYAASRPTCSACSPGIDDRVNATREAARRRSRPRAWTTRSSRSPRPSTRSSTTRTRRRVQRAGRRAGVAARERLVRSRQELIREVRGGAIQPDLPGADGAVGLDQPLGLRVQVGDAGTQQLPRRHTLAGVEVRERPLRRRRASPTSGSRRSATCRARAAAHPRRSERPARPRARTRTRPRRARRRRTPARPARASPASRTWRAGAARTTSGACRGRCRRRRPTRERARTTPSSGSPAERLDGGG